MDALPPTLAVACAGFMSSLFCDPSFADELPFDVFSQVEKDVMHARCQLQEKGWDAIVYGVGVYELLDRLATLAAGHARSAFDSEGVDLLHGLWAGRRLPHDVDYEELARLRA